MRWLLTTRRRIVQGLSLFALTSNFSGTSLGAACVPILHCEACALTWLGCPIGIMASSVGFHEIPWLLIGIVVALGALFGRFLCGWVCPTGFVLDLLYKIPSPKIELPRWTGWIKYAVLLVMGVGVAYWLGRESIFFFCSVCPTAAVECVIPDLLRYSDVRVTFETGIKLGVLAFTIALAIVNRRSFCKVICPIGAMVALTNKFTVFSLRLDSRKCIHCGRCDKECPMDVAVEDCSRSGRKINRAAECVECLSCEQACPVDAIGNNSKVLHK